MTWDPFQRTVLAELGHVLYAPVLPADAGLAQVAGTADIDPAMLSKLARAVGVDVGVLVAHTDIAMASSTLRGDAAAKRALWPRLRALRRDAR